ncbi:uncharacterized protein LOC118279232 isoform X1 [Spodoptera frugiperda]|uniref:Uncharacterized protein LOC118279232 isoform X1 n=1 Tax=Spodoptera frugiperda TaxID=7108 RepID=A0A9R0DI78_SPOFR|nr:uncharacterized protein LOC118279232 isoform X1 [Spodoptera frugiperda]
MEPITYSSFRTVSEVDLREDFTPVNDYNTSFADIVWSALSTTTIFLIIIFMVTCIRVVIMGQKTRSPQQRRMYVGSRARPSLGQAEPSIFVSPSNLPPPPKYECMAPPSYEEVVGVHYPNYQVQPITQPITTALAQTSTDTTTRPDSRSNETVVRNNDETVVTVVSAPRVATTSS